MSGREISNREMSAAERRATEKGATGTCHRAKTQRDFGVCWESKKSYDRDTDARRSKEEICNAGEDEGGFKGRERCKRGRCQRTARDAIVATTER